MARRPSRRRSLPASRTRACATLQSRLNATSSPALAIDQAKATMRMRDGTTHTVSIEHGVGSLIKPMSDDELSAKFLSQARGVLADDAARKLLDASWNVRELDNVADASRARGRYRPEKAHDHAPPIRSQGAGRASGGRSRRAGLRAEPIPTAPIKLIVPYLAGGATDVGARVVAERMSKGLGQPIVIDNRPGAGVIVGTNAVAKADPDGYTLLITTLAHPINITLQKKLPYDSIADFEPVALMGIINFILVVHPSSPVTDLPSLVKYLKDNPDKANYGSAGTGSPMHLGPELFKSLTGVAANHVPYRGEAAALNDMIGGRLTFMLSGTPTVAPHIQSGAVRALATPSPKRSSLVPEVPTTDRSRHGGSGRPIPAS